MHKQLRGKSEDAPITSFGNHCRLAGTQQPKDGVDGGHSGSKNVSAPPAFEFSDGALQRFAIGMIGARVVVAFVFSKLALHVGGGLVDGRNNGAGGWIRLLPYVNSIGGKTHGGLLLPMPVKREAAAMLKPSRRATRTMKCTESRWRDTDRRAVSLA